MTVRVVGVGFAHLHLHGLLADAEALDGVEIVGLCDEAPGRRELDVESTARAFDVPDEAVFADLEACLAATDPDLALVCAAPADHADRVERLARAGVDVLLEKPFAPSLADGDRMLAAADEAGTRLAVNWPLAFYPPHVTTKRLIEAGRVGEVRAVHYHDGNRGSGRFAGVSVGPEGDLVGADGPADPESWWFDPDAGGGSLVDYLGYGTTLATWFRDGEVPHSVTAATHAPADLAVDTGSVTVAHYDTGLSTFRTSWETFTDPWEHQPHPRCGVVVAGTEGTVASWDYQETVTLQTDAHPAGREVPVDAVDVDPVAHVVDCVREDQPISSPPMAPELNRASLRIVDAARRSAEAGETVPLPE